MAGQSNVSSSSMGGSPTARVGPSAWQTQGLKAARNPNQRQRVDPKTFYSPNQHLQMAGPLYFDDRNQPLPGQITIEFSPLGKTEAEISGRGVWGIYTTDDPGVIAHLEEHMASQRDSERDVFTPEEYMVKSKAASLDDRATEVMVARNQELEAELAKMKLLLGEQELGKETKGNDDKTDPA